MKKVLYFALLALELFVDTLLMISLWEGLFYVTIAASAIVVGLLVWLVVWYFKTNNPATKRKILLFVPFVMLIPIAVFAVTYIVVAIAFIFASI